MIELKILGNSAEEIKEQLAVLFGGKPGYSETAVETAAKAATKAPKKEAGAEAEAKPPTEPQSEPVGEEKTKVEHSLEDIKKITAEAIRAGKREEVIALLDKYAAKTVKDIKESNYDEYAENIGAIK